MTDGDHPRRYLIASGTGQYSSKSLGDLPGVEEDVARIVELFSSMGYTRVLSEVSANPTTDAFKSSLEEWLSAPDRHSSDIIVVYYAGHGVKAKGRHYLMCADSRDDRLVSTALRTDDLALMFTDPATPGNILMTLDTCYAGAGAGEMAATASQLSGLRPADAGGLWLLAAARSRDEATEHAFVDALASILNLSHAGSYQPFVDLFEVTDRVNSYFSSRHPHQHASCSAVDAGGLPPFFPNPTFIPGLPADEMNVEAIRRMRRERIAHFDPSARGVERASEEGSYFTGRKAALAVLSNWLMEPQHDLRARVVTGGPGAGKSALLGRLLNIVDSSDDIGGALPVLPPPGSINAHFHLHRRTLEEVVGHLGGCLGQIGKSLDELLLGLRERRSVFTMVVDALDEAGTAGDQSEAVRIARELLRPLSAMPTVRLIVGSRRGPISTIGNAVEYIDLDADTYVGPEDVADYAEALLVGAGTPTRYSNEPVLAKDLARGIALQAGRSFLVARMTARALLHGQVNVDVTRSGWERQLPTEVAGAFAAYLSRFGRAERLVRRLLTPLAYAEGLGLPWDNIWAPLAAALSSEPCSDDDIGWLLENAGAYILEVKAGERSVFKLYHEALADYLRDERRTAEAHRRITETLVSLVPAERDPHKDWERAHPYIRAHLASHAAPGGELDNLLSDAGFLVHAEPGNLLASLKHVASRSGKRTAAVYRATCSVHQHAGVKSRRQLLALDAARYQVANLTEFLCAKLGWTILWATGSQANPALQSTLMVEGHSIADLAYVTIDSRSFAVSCCRDGTLRIWDIHDATEPTILRGHDGPVNSICCVQIDQRPVAISGGSDGTVRVWDLTNREQLSVLYGHVGSVNCVAAVRSQMGEVVIASGGDDRRICVWDFSGSDPRYVLAGHTRSVLSLAFHEDGSQSVAPDSLFSCLVSSSADGTIRTWNVQNGTETAILRGHAGEVRAVTCTNLQGAAVVVSGGEDKKVRIWDLDRGEQIGALAAHLGSIRGVASADLDGRPVAITCGDDATARIWDLLSQRQTAILTGHTDWIHAVTFTAGIRKPVILTGGSDGTVRTWETSVANDGHLVGHVGEVNAVAYASRRGRPVVVSGGDDRTIRVWDAATGRHEAILSGHTGLVRGISSACIDGQSVFVSGSSDGTARIWNLDDATELVLLTGHTDWVGAVACTTVRGRPIVITGSDDRTVRTWDIRSGAQQSILTGHAGAINCVVCLDVRGRAVTLTGAADGTLRLWDLETGYEQEVFVGHSGWVRAVDSIVVDGIPIAVSGADDGTVRMWDLLNGVPMGVLGRHGAGVNGISCALDSAGQPVAFTVGDDSRICAWDLRARKLSNEVALPYPGWSVTLAPQDELVIAFGWEIAVYKSTTGMGWLRY